MGGAQMMPLSAGAARPLGATADAAGVNFALAAPAARAVELCLFDESGAVQDGAQFLPACSAGVWHGYLAGARPGQVYGYRVHGPLQPNRGMRFNPALVLLDPYAREIVGSYHGQDGAFRARVVSDDANLCDGWDADTAPRTALADTVLYEAHVKGLTRMNMDVAPALRGSYAGLADPAMLDYLVRLGVTAVSLLPLHQHADESRLTSLGLSNYWGYSTIGFFAPEPRYWSGRPGTSPASELRDMVKALHERGIEIILDVVYNHTGELDENGPTLSLRGIDNALYYRLGAEDSASYENFTGCGNTLNMDQLQVRELVLDSLRYWVQAFHIDGFRFDLAPVLGRVGAGFSADADFFSALRQDPVLAQVKLIAEPWDLGPDGYQLGAFPPEWLEWNDKYRDTMRRFWLQGSATLGQFAMRFAGSSDLFQHNGRSPLASVNFICAHDGFTLRDLLSYEQRHNLANGEGNRDGHAHNLGWNCGVEGETSDPQVLAMRARLRRAVLATLIFSHGSPMLLAGDELGHSQQGNNNAYCQDNPISWIDWRCADTSLAAYVAQLLALRKRYASLRRAKWTDPIIWCRPDGTAMAESDWHDETQHSIAIRLDGKAETCLLLVNAAPGEVTFSVPAGAWRLVLNSAQEQTEEQIVEGCATVCARAVWLTVGEPTNENGSE